MDKGITGAAVFSNNVTFVGCVVSAWEDMPTVMFVHARLNGLFFITNAQQQEA